ISVVTGPDGERRVGPAYDLPSTVPYGDRSLALPLAGKLKGLSRARLLRFAAAIGLPEKAAGRMLDATLSATAGVVDDLLAGALPFDGTTIKSMISELRFRRRQLTA
ncbi:MAG: type II toxin-antitoxin system HipA family toxin, partial [Acidimicrobiia bacterium]